MAQVIFTGPTPDRPNPFSQLAEGIGKGFGGALSTRADAEQAASSLAALPPEVTGGLDKNTLVDLFVASPQLLKNPTSVIDLIKGKDTEIVRNLKAAGLKPGTPEFRDALLRASKAVEGDSTATLSAGQALVNKKTGETIATGPAKTPEQTEVSRLLAEADKAETDGRPTAAATLRRRAENLAGKSLAQIEAEAAATARGTASVKTAEPKSDAGKQVYDRNLFVSQYGEGSPQVQAFDAAAKSTGGPKLTDASSLRGQFLQQSKDFVQVRDAFGKIAASTKDPSAAGDLALIFNFMKILDPGSVVREGEFATAQNAASVPDQIRNLYNRIKTGQRLNEAQRADFVKQAGNVFGSQLQMQAQLEKTFKNIATSGGFKPDDIAVDLIGTYRSNLGGQQVATPQTEADFNALPSGALYRDPDDGKTYRKP